MSLSVSRERALRAAVCVALSMGFVMPALGSHGQMTVRGERLSTTAPGVDAARTEAARTPGGAGVVSSDDYADGRASTLQDMFVLAPGVYAQSRFGADEARLSIRGSGLQRTFHLRGIYLLQDGVSLTLADGGGDFQAVEPMALAYTEVLRGANALRYGGGTLGGSINFVSPSGFDGAGLRARLEGGSFGYGRVLVSMGGALGAARGEAGLTDYFVSASTHRQEGFRDWSEQRNARLFGNLGVRFGEHVESRFFVAALNSDSQLPGSLTKAQLLAGPDAANAGNLSGRQKRDYDLYRLAQLTSIDLHDAVLEFNLGYSYKDLWHPIFQALQQRSHDYTAGVRYLRDGHWLGRDSRWVLGVTPSWNTTKDDRFVNVAGQPGARTGESRQRAENLVVYGQNELAVARDWTLVVGAQWSESRREFLDRFLTNGDQGFEATYSRISPKLGFLWRAREQWTVFGNVSDSFEPPSFGELSGGPGISQVAAQHARTVELGSRGRAGRVDWDVALYSAAVRDELLSLNAPGGQPLGTVNAPRTVHRGVEAGLGVAVAPAVFWHVSSLLNDFRFDDHATYGDNRLPGIARQLHRSELTWKVFPQYSLVLNGEWSPERYAIDMDNSWFADAHAIWGLKVAYKNERGLSWFVEGRNLSDKRYAATTGVIADANATDAAQFLPGDGRAVFAGFEWKLKK